jgi:CheY-like chemotaxis protein
LEAARLEAEEARRIKSRFVANISHELRTPLNIIVGFAEMLCTSPEVYGSFDWPPSLREDLLAIWRNAEHLLNMVDDVLDLAQVEAARLPITPELTDLNQLIRETLVAASALLRHSPLDLRVALTAKVPLLNLDRTRIRQVLLNLINNAVRFTEQGYIEVGSYLRDQEVVVYVRDTGPGIPAEKLETIFEEFEQVDTSIRRPHQGAGLGLAVSRQFIRLHAGRIWAESDLGGGSTFAFSLPLPGKKTAIQPLQPRRQGQPRGSYQEEEHRVVVLCRDPIAVRLLERHLEGLALLAAGSPAEAAGLVKQWHPEAACIIVEGPSELVEAMAAAHELLDAVQPFDLTVVVCSLPTERGASLALGVAELLVKPVTQAEIVAAIKRLSPEPSRVLVVDDEPDMLRLLARVIRREWRQAEVLAATSGEAAIALLPRRPDLILLDLLMPGMTGAEVLNVLRSNRETASIPVVVITARGPAQDLQVLRRGELRVIRNSSLSATELVRLLNLLTKALPPHYLSGAPGRPGTPAVALA